MSSSDGFLLIDKPGGVSSFAMVRKMRSVLSIRKAGHAGTLDPLADGLLVLAFGRATRLIRFLPLEPKVYEFTVQFGTLTDTLDAEGRVVASDGRIPDKGDLVEILGNFQGVQMQQPPVYSALKVGGKRSYALAREGNEPVLQPREITVEDIALTHFDAEGGSAGISVTCSGGTYVRALARDIAEKLGTIGYASAIRRTQIGIFDVEHAHVPEAVSRATPLISLEKALASLPGISVTGDVLRSVCSGRDIQLDQEDIAPNGYTMALNNNKLVALLRKTETGSFHPELVLGDGQEGGLANT